MNSPGEETSAAFFLDRKWSVTTQLVSAYIGHNQLDTDAFLDLIGEVMARVERLEREAGGRQQRQPAVPISESVRDDFLVCLEDGRRFKSMKRHLRSKYNLSPQAYRDRWGLPDAYPMVAPSYARKRSRLAKEMGLGKETNDTKSK